MGAPLPICVVPVCAPLHASGDEGCKRGGGALPGLHASQRGAPPLGLHAAPSSLAPSYTKEGAPLPAPPFVCRPWGAVPRGPAFTSCLMNKGGRGDKKRGAYLSCGTFACKWGVKGGEGGVPLPVHPHSCVNGSGEGGRQKGRVGWGLSRGPAASTCPFAHKRGHGCKGGVPCPMRSHIHIPCSCVNEAEGAGKRGGRRCKGGWGLSHVRMSCSCVNGIRGGAKRGGAPFPCPLCA